MLHGGSGLSSDDFKKAISKGISKINIFTDINIAAVEAEFSAFDHMDKGIIDLIPAAVNAVKAAVERKIEVFGSAGKGKRTEVWQEEIVRLVAEEIRKEFDIRKK